MKTMFVSAISSSGNKCRINEDSWLIFENQIPPRWITAAVIDGASTRILLPSIKKYLTEHVGEIEPAVWAASIIQNSLQEKFIAEPSSSPNEALIHANQKLLLNLKSIPGMSNIYELLEQQDAKPLPIILSKLPKNLAEEIQKAFSKSFPSRWHDLDSRYLRLILPVCVVTIIKLDIDSGIFTFSHLGDTVLVKVTANGLLILTEDQMGQFDEIMLNRAVELVKETNTKIESVIEAVKSYPAVREQNILNGVRHNYVNRKGKAVPSEGCGVINGLSKAEYYIQTGRSNLQSGEKLYIMSDGLTLPLYIQSNADIQEPFKTHLNSYQQALRMGDILKLLQHSREIENLDSTGNIFPRAKVHDDATCVIISKH